MSLVDWLVLSFTLIFILFLSVCFGQSKRPNIVVILSDDVGFEEFGVYNVIDGEES